MFIPNLLAKSTLIVTLRYRLSWRPQFCSPGCNVDSFSPLAVISDYEAPHGHRLVWVDGIEWLAMGNHISYYWFLVIGPLKAKRRQRRGPREAELLAGDTDQVSRSLAHGLPCTVVQAHRRSLSLRWQV